MKCQHINKKTGKSCNARAVAGRPYCVFHGGKSPNGIASPAFKSGKYSKYIPPRLMERYQQSLTDTEILSLRDSLALVEARIADLLNRTDTGEAGVVWRALSGAFGELKRAMKAQDAQAINLALGQLQAAINRGSSDYAAWDEVIKLIDVRRRLSESERKRLVDMNLVIGAEQATALVAAIVQSIRRRVSDRTELRLISGDIQQLLNQSSMGGSGAIRYYDIPAAEVIKNGSDTD